MSGALLIAHLLDAVFGEPQWLWSRLPHPAALMGRLISLLENRLNKGRYRRAKGVLAIAVLVTAGGATGTVISALPGVWADSLLAAILIAQRSLCDHVQRVAEALGGSLAEGRDAVSMIVGRETATLSEAEISRAAIESGAENLSDGVIAPAFWFLVAGAPGIVIYKCVNTADSMIGYRSAKYLEFGWASARLDDFLNLAPARLTAVFIALTKPASGALKVMWRDARKHRSPNAGWPEAAMAGALGLALSGPRRYETGQSNDPFLNPGGRQLAQAGDISRSVDILWRAWFLWIAVLFMATILINV